MSDLDRLRRSIAEMSSGNLESLQGILNSLLESDWEGWLREVNEIRYTDMVPCRQCHHNFIPDFNEIRSRTITAMICDPCYDAIINHPLPCSFCKCEFIRSELKGVRVPASSPYHYGSYCAECLIQVTELSKVVCLLCGERYPPSPIKTRQFCESCSTPKNIHELDRVVAHNTRARDLELPATLTLKQWIATLEHFHWKCAYCSGSHDGLEHYLPLTLAGGTTVDNCLPTCKRCNARKKDKHPDVFARLFPAENLARIRGYLESVSSLALK